MTTLADQGVKFVTLDTTTVGLIAVPIEDCSPVEDSGEVAFTPRVSPPRIYIAGPMRGYDKWNFPAFDAARNEKLAQGFQVISPADLDRARGITEDTTDFDPGEFRLAMKIDMQAVLLCTHIFMLRGWEKSTGARNENAWANILGRTVEFQEGAFVGHVELAVWPGEVAA